MAGVVEDVLGGRKVERVMRDTWGHMDANPGTRYKGTILFAECEFSGDGTVALACDFGNAGFGPWFYEGIQDWLFEQETEPGFIYRFEGYYQLARGGHHKFVGEITEYPADPTRREAA